MQVLGRRKSRLQEGHYAHVGGSRESRRWQVGAEGAKGALGHYFEELLLCALGEQFNVGDEITGLVLSVRFAESVLSVWNRN